jgi:hypothetical protein
MVVGYQGPEKVSSPKISLASLTLPHHQPLLQWWNDHSPQFTYQIYVQEHPDYHSVNCSQLPPSIRL